ncbi:MAG: 2-hydroxyacid dehydrogenase [Alphaproteobacteria bacterium]
MKVLLHYDAGPELRKLLTEVATAGLDIDCCPEADEALFRRRVAEADVLWHVLKPVTKEHIAAAPRLKLIQKIGVGVNTIDLDAARFHRVQVANMPGTNTPAVAEMTLLLMLSALRYHPPLDRATRSGRGWVEGPARQERFGELGGRTVGLIGYGGVPRHLAPALRALGCDVIYFARTPQANAVGTRVPLAELLAIADIVSLHVPLTDETRHMIDSAAIARMKRGAVLINTARGGLIDEPALVAALKSGQLAAAGLDVFDSEPVDPNNPLLSLDNVVLMPHLAWLTRETWQRSLAVAAENCRHIERGTAILHRVA